MPCGAGELWIQQLSATPLITIDRACPWELWANFGWEVVRTRVWKRAVCGLWDEGVPLELDQSVGEDWRKDRMRLYIWKEFFRFIEKNSNIHLIRNFSLYVTDSFLNLIKAMNFTLFSQRKAIINTKYICLFKGIHKHP